MPLTAGQRALLESLLTQRLHALQRQLMLHQGESRVAHAQELLEPWALRCGACESVLESRHGGRLST